MTNIAIVGKMYAGKTTLADALVPHGYQKSMMAGPLKAIARLAYGEEIDKGKQYETTVSTRVIKFKSGRQILQEVGQSMKEVDRDFWLKCFINDIEFRSQLQSSQRRSSQFVVDDVRFKFEADYLREAGWTIVKVETPEIIRLDRGRKALGRSITPEELYHESEIEVDSIEADTIWRGDTPLNKYEERAAALLAGISAGMLT